MIIVDNCLQFSCCPYSMNESDFLIFLVQFLSMPFVYHIYVQLTSLHCMITDVCFYIFVLSFVIFPYASNTLAFCVLIQMSK